MNFMAKNPVFDLIINYISFLSRGLNSALAYLSSTILSPFNSLMWSA